MPFITARVVSIVRADAVQALANAGPNQSVLCASIVQLEGEIIGDDIANHTFVWEQTFGTPVTLINPNTLTPSFVNPQVSDLEFTLYVDRNTPYEDSDTVFISRAPETFVAAWGGNESGNPQGTGTTIQGQATASNTIGTNNEFYLNAYVGGWSYLNPPEARFSPIFTPDDLDRVRRNISGSYWLMNDIDLSRWGNWEPIGTRGRPFCGEFQGNGFEIRNMSITSSSKDAGLFSAVGLGATIERLGVTSATISGVGSSVYKGILAGTAQNTLGSDGGDVTIRNCYTEGTIASGSDLAGGFIGNTGSNASSVYENTYADVTVTGGGADTGGWAGTFDGTPTYVENYGNTTKTAAVVGTGAPGATEVSGLTTAQLNSQANYTDWDFIGTWQIDEGVSPATLRIDRPHEAAPADRGACDDQWEIRWPEVTDLGNFTSPPAYVFKGIIVEENTGGVWTNARYIPRERNAALMTPDTQHRITTVWDQYYKSKHSIRENSRTLGNRQFAPTKEVQIVNPGVHGSKNTSSQFGPYGVDRISAWGGTNAASANLVITIENPKIIIKAVNDPSTFGMGGDNTHTTVSTLERYTLLRMLPPDSQDTGTFGMGGNGQSTHADIEGMTVTRLSGISIG